ncbi:MAG: phage tail assembly chaperone [Candidatus Thorarchaeota archaeon]
MRWELEYSEKAFVVEAALERGLPIPSFARNEPGIYPQDMFFLSAFGELSTCRQIGMAAGPIPWRDIIEFARFSELDESLLDMFVRVIRTMDNVYLEWMRKKAENA